LHAALATVPGVHAVQASNEPGVHIDVSAQESFMQHRSRHISQWTYAGLGQRRDRRDYSGQDLPHTARMQEGWLCIAGRNVRWDAIAPFLGLDGFTGNGLADPQARTERWQEIDPTFRASMATHTRYEWFAAAAERGFIFGPIHELQEAMACEQFAARGFWEHTDIDGTPVKMPGLPFRWKEEQTPWLSKQSSSRGTRAWRRSP
jgi:crotonobetainyl-CoA:carnitine CoA-transferase CaiB-like acyl-CoA transferase